MNIEEAKKLFDEGNKIRWEIREKKGKDYAHPDNIHLNFQQRAKIIEILEFDLTDPSQIALMDVVLKIQRIVNLRKQGVTPENESLQDSYRDAKNYLDLSEEQL